MRKLFIKNLLLLQLLNIIVKPVWLLVVDRMAQNLLGTEVYGEYYLVLNITLLFNIFLDLGIQNFNNTSIASDASFFRKNFKTIFLLKSFLSSAYIILVLFIGLQSGLPLNLLGLLITNQVLTTFILYLRTNINGLHYYVTDSLLSVSDKFFAILICIAFYLTEQIDIIHFVIAQLLASCITFTIALLVNLSLWNKLQVSVTESVKNNLRLLIHQSLPYALLFTLMNFYTRMDVSMMNWLLSDAVYHGGLYAQSFRLLDAAAMFAMLFAGLLLPMFARMIYSGEDVRNLAHLAARILFIISLTVAMASCLFSEEILGALYHYPNTEQLSESAKVFRNIMLTFVPMSITFVFSTLLTAKKDIRYMNVFALTAFAANFTINLFLIPTYASFGASIGSLITQSVFAFLCLWRCFTLFTFRIPWIEILKYLILLVLLFGVYFFLKPMENIWMMLILFSVASLLFCMALQLIEIRKIRQLFDKSTQ